MMSCIIKSPENTPGTSPSLGISQRGNGEKLRLVSQHGRLAGRPTCLVSLSAGIHP